MAELYEDKFVSMCIFTLSATPVEPWVRSRIRSNDWNNGRWRTLRVVIDGYYLVEVMMIKQDNDDYDDGN
jgi:hypothetical protein